MATKKATKKVAVKAATVKVPGLYVKKIQRMHVENVNRDLTRVFYAIKKPCGCSEQAFLELIWDQPDLTDEQIKEAIHELHKSKDRGQE